MTCDTTKGLLGKVACTTIRTTGRAARAAVIAGGRELLPELPDYGEVPPGEIVDLPGRGRTFVVDVPGPTPYAPTLVLLHALSCTAYLGWAATIGALSQHYRVVTFDQRWHGRGIRSPRFRLRDCADDVAAVMDSLEIDRAILAGYSMGGAIAQQTWHRHHGRVTGLVLCSTASTWKGNKAEQLFFPVMSVATHPLSAYALAKVELRAALLPDSPSVDLSDAHRWARDEFRSTSMWMLPEVLAEMGRFDGRAWLSSVAVPTAVVVTDRDRAIPARRQLEMAAAIPGATVFHAPGGHTSVFTGSRTWLPVFLEAVDSVAVRVRDAAGASQGPGVIPGVLAAGVGTSTA